MTKQPTLGDKRHRSQEGETESEEDKDIEFNLPSSHGKDDGPALSNHPGIVTPSSPLPRRGPQPDPCG